MIEAIRRSIALPHIPVEIALSVGTVATFGWLLLQDHLHPLLVYLLQLYHLSCTPCIRKRN